MEDDAARLARNSLQTKSPRETSHGYASKIKASRSSNRGTERYRKACAIKLRTLFLSAVLCAAPWLAFLVLAPAGPDAEAFVDIPNGTSSRAIGVRLEAAHIIRSEYAFDLLRAIKGQRLQAGEYRFDHPAPLTEVYSRLARGDVFTRTVIIPEGFNLFDVAAAVEAAGLADKSTFLAAARGHTELIASLSPNARSLEGYLYPDTYRFSRHTTPAQMLTTMVKRFRQTAASLHLLDHPEDISKVVTTASLIEKEVAANDERPLVAGVFANRLHRDMPLQTDPSVVYGALLDGRWRGTIYRSDLDSPSPYNTYRHPGLPPGPICNPGLAALRAALNPAKTDYLYFVADAQGHSRFAATLAEHQANVESYHLAQNH